MFFVKAIHYINLSIDVNSHSCYNKLYKLLIKGDVFVNIRYTKILLTILLLYSIISISTSISKANTNNISSGFSEIEDKIYTTLISSGYSHAGACGIMGNMSVENPEFIPDLEANHGATYGLFQWSDVGNRKTNLFNWCNNRILHPKKVEGQLAFAIYELSGGDTIAAKANDYLKNTTDSTVAAMEFAAGFERCIGSTSNPKNDSKYNGLIYPERKGSTYQALAKRISKANEYDLAYKDFEILPENVLNIKQIPTAGLIAELEDKIEKESIPTVVPVVIDKSLIWKSKILCLLIGYLFGMILISEFFNYKHKLKKKFSIGNKIPDLQSVLKNIGYKEAFIMFACDVIKCYLAFLICFLITKGILYRDLFLWCGLGLILGNDFPFWNKFKGSIGITIALIIILSYMPIWGIICIILGLIAAVIAKSFPIGALCITILASIFSFFCRGIISGIIILVILSILIIKYHKLITKKIRKIKKSHTNS